MSANPSPVQMSLVIVNIAIMIIVKVTKILP